MSGTSPRPKPTRYDLVIQHIFDANYTPGALKVPFDREEMTDATTDLGLNPIKNLGDLVYTYRFRKELPQSIRDAAPPGMEWVIRGAGRAKYSFDIVKRVRITPDPTITAVKVPDSTPELITSAALSDEQALLALLRYNRLVDVFLGISAHSLQNHLRTYVDGLGQVEVDEVYVGVGRHGEQYILPVQAKTGKDELGLTQVEQDIAVCADKWPHLVARPIATQFMAGGVIAMFELEIVADELRVVQEAHYVLTSAANISESDLAKYRDDALRN